MWDIFLFRSITVIILLHECSFLGNRVHSRHIGHCLCPTQVQRICQLGRYERVTATRVDQCIGDVPTIDLDFDNSGNIEAT